MKQLLIHDNQAESLFIQKIEAIPELLEEVKRELTAQKVDHKLKLSDLKDGNFVTIFEDYHESKMQQRIPEADFEQWLILCNIDTDKLTELENRYKKLLDIKYPFYTLNHDYWQSIEWRAGKLTPNLVEKLKNAPAKKVYSIDDFLKITKDTYKVSVNPEFFKLYLTNDKQAEAMEVVTDQVKLCKRRKDSPAATIKIAGELVKDIDADYNITWNYNAILNIK